MWWMLLTVWRSVMAKTALMLTGVVHVVFVMGINTSSEKKMNYARLSAFRNSNGALQHTKI